MTILPVLDLMGGLVVRGIAGRRETYQPIVSNLTASSQPLAIARAFREHFGLTELYLADLDAIRGERPALATYHALQSNGFRLWVDAGLRTARDLTTKLLVVANVANIVIGLESVISPDEVGRIARQVGVDRAVFSLDMKAGRTMVENDAWPSREPFRIAEHAIVDLGIRRLIVLDLASVGMGQGVTTLDLCARIKRQNPHVEVIAGGGVRGFDDLLLLRSTGVDHVLVASALHDGRLTRKDIGRI